MIQACPATTRVPAEKGSLGSSTEMNSISPETAAPVIPSVTSQTPFCCAATNAGINRTSKASRILRWIGLVTIAQNLPPSVSSVA